MQNECFVCPITTLKRPFISSFTVVAFFWHKNSNMVICRVSQCFLPYGPSFLVSIELDDLVQRATANIIIVATSDNERVAKSDHPSAEDLMGKTRPWFVSPCYYFRRLPWQPSSPHLTWLQRHIGHTVHTCWKLAVLQWEWKWMCLLQGCSWRYQRRISAHRRLGLHRDIRSGSPLEGQALGWIDHL